MGFHSSTDASATIGSASCEDGIDNGADDNVVKGVTRDDLHALWNYLDADKSNEVSCQEWQLGLYRLQLDAWPDADEATLVRVVDCICKAADKWHRAAGNWYKIFNLVDTENSGRIGY